MTVLLDPDQQGEPGQVPAGSIGDRAGEDLPFNG
jgi:hypothetical protein